MTQPASSLWDDLEHAIESPSSPVSTPSQPHARKRPRLDESDNSDTEDEATATPAHQPTVFATPSISTPAIAFVNRNTVAHAKRLATKLNLHGEQQSDLEIFATDTPTVQSMKLFARLLTLENKLNKIITAAPVYQVSEDLATNIWNYSLGVMFSSKLAAYKGATPLNHVLDILKKYRFDLPPGIEHNHADWAKVTSATQNTLTQIRSKIKKALRHSLKGTPEKHQNIYDLTQHLIVKSSCKVTVQLCARVALMRAVYLEDSSDKFWDKVDVHLSKIRAKATSAEKLIRAFTHVLKTDRKMHGIDTKYEISAEYGADHFQQQVDDAIIGGLTGGHAHDDPPSRPASPRPTAASTTDEELQD